MSIHFKSTHLYWLQVMRYLIKLSEDSKDEAWPLTWMRIYFYRGYKIFIQVKMCHVMNRCPFSCLFTCHLSLPYYTRDAEFYFFLPICHIFPVLGVFGPDVFFLQNTHSTHLNHQLLAHTLDPWKCMQTLAYVLWIYSKYFPELT